MWQQCDHNNTNTLKYNTSVEPNQLELVQKGGDAPAELLKWQFLMYFNTDFSLLNYPSAVSLKG